jgi:two-component system C4-dicarboxylate transport response regulator DctD
METILLVEDDSAVRETVATMLHSLDYIVLAPEPGEPALRAINAGGYDAVITDFVMPDANGNRIVEAVRAVRADCPIIAISGGSPEIAAATALRQTRTRGANATLSKPFTREALVRAIKTAIGP